MHLTNLHTEIIINNLPGIFYLFDKKGTFIVWNKNFEHITGYDPSEIATMKPSDFFSGAEKDFILRLHNQILESGSAEEELQLVTKGGVSLPYLFTGNLTRIDGREFIIGMGIDISHQKKIETALKESEQGYKELFDQSPLPQWILDAHSFRFLKVSKAAITHYGYSEEEFLNMSILDLLIKVEQKLILHDKTAFPVTKNSFYSKWKHKKKNGEVIQTEVTSVAVPYDNKDGVLCIINDVTEKLKLQEELTSSVIKAQERERSELGMELHDNVNQILTTVKLYNEMYGSGMQSDKKLIDKSIHYLQLCIDEIRGISKRLSAPSLGKISIEDSIRELISSINVTNKLKIEYSIQGLSNVKVNADLHLAIYRIVQEQLSNILKHAEATAVKITLSLHSKKNCLQLQIVDNGRGFNSNSNTKGIGLSNMKSRAEDMQGKLQVISAPGYGCTLIATFPFH